MLSTKESYDKLLFSPGAKPTQPRLPGVGISRVFTLRTVDELRDWLAEIEAGKPVYVICQSGLRSYIASRIPTGNGYDCYNFAGGYRFYDAVMNDRCLIDRASDCGMNQH